MTTSAGLRAAPSAPAPRSAPATECAETVVELDGPLDLGLTLGPLQRGRGDPAVRIDASGSGAWLCRRPSASSCVPDGAADRSSDRAARSGPRAAATVRLDLITVDRVRVRAWAADPLTLEAALREAPALVGDRDDWREFEDLLRGADDPCSRALLSVRRRHPGLRLPAAGQLTAQLVTVILEQKVTHDQARSCWRQLLRGFGEPPPGPAPEGMRVPPSASVLHGVPAWRWHRMWVQPQLARTVRLTVERDAALRRLERTETGLTSTAQLAETLTRLPGIGAWTAAETLQRTHGAADLVSVGDCHLAQRVGEALTGRRTDDAGMLRLLSPWSGHRQRVVRLIGLSGLRPQRYGPKLAPADHRGR
ncbi:DNA-3-methyladenine glycosylase family protein [Nesterenkonia marinintestina]|uniref:DNA-3-methyladenine glycosylase family protein n=1 Tax=Nesterenkonia marinintestina TaxID=2979865 RepID=UPI0021C03F2C|nr:3-methyladenine DNA glycosylase [Nesterenkonia sp. GX14115]